MPKKVNRKGTCSESALFLMGDRVLYPEPHRIDEWDLTDLEQAGAQDERARTIWNAAKNLILADWSKKFPGTRPSFFWIFDSPGPRERLGGVGDPAWLHLAYAESYRLGIPDVWISDFDVEYFNGRARDVHGEIIATKYTDGDFQGNAIDLANPPTYESQAQYLQRHGLLTPDEIRRLKPRDLEPELVLPEDSTVQ
jgi:hypothetical protein